MKEHQFKVVINEESQAVKTVKGCEAYVAKHNHRSDKPHIVIVVGNEVLHLDPELKTMAQGSKESLTSNYTLRPLNADESVTIQGTY